MLRRTRTLRTGESFLTFVRTRGSTLGSEAATPPGRLTRAFEPAVGSELRVSSDDFGAVCVVITIVVRQDLTCVVQEDSEHVVPRLPLDLDAVLGRLADRRTGLDDVDHTLDGAAQDQRIRHREVR